MPQTKPSRPQKFGPRALKVLKHLAENPYATQKELLDLIRPESLTHYVNTDYAKLLELEKGWGRPIKDDELHMVATAVQRPASDRWGCAYFLQKTGMYTSDWRASLIIRGVVAISPIKRGRCKTYVITPKGMAVLGGLI